jgi:hypothetical protein
MKVSISKIPLHPPFSKWEFGQGVNMPLFEKACPETRMRDVVVKHECSFRGTMVEILAVEPRRHFDGKPDIHPSGL